jgi:MoxR-like ATPase
MLADEICRLAHGAHYFQWAAHALHHSGRALRRREPQALEEDDYRRLTTHKLPEAHIAFLDEIFKASSSILQHDPDAHQRTTLPQRAVT